SMQLNGRDERERRAIVYLVPWYPALSPTFVLREVEALRRLGRTVSTMSIHRPRADDVLAEADRRAYATTYFLSPPRLRDHVAAHWRALRTRPRAYAATLVAALRAGPMEPSVRARGLLYFCEAVVTWWHARRSGATHIHGVFSGPAADADMLQIPRASLAAKVRSASFVTVSSDFGRSQLMVLVDQEHWDKICVVHCG